MKVYDILNAGPNHRFTIRGKDGKPFIVSNCVQALARCVMTEKSIKVNSLYPVKMSTHDELTALVILEDKDFAKDKIHQIMIGSISWLPGVKIGSETKVGLRYGEIK